jgi:hypothetical protein
MDFLRGAVESTAPVHLRSLVGGALEGKGVRFTGIFSCFVPFDSNCLAVIAEGL